MKFYGLIFSWILLLCACAENTNTSMEEENEASTESTEAVKEMQDNMLTEVEQEMGWQLLFDGTGMEGWKGYNMNEIPDNWKVEDGILKVMPTKEKPKDRDIITTDKYKDFELELDFMLTDAANSGILYFVKEVEDTPIWHSAPEYQLIDDENYLATASEDETRNHLSGENYDLQSAPGRYLKGTGVWNTARIVVKDKKVEHYLNGQKTIEYDLGSEAWKALVANSKFKDYEDYGSAEEGHIGLQYHDDEVYFKNIKIRRL
ncbi:MAG: DUF1080 domain-containing protein [Bacteroidota bacterium]